MKLGPTDLAFFFLFVVSSWALTYPLPRGYVSFLQGIFPLRSRLVGLRHVFGGQELGRFGPDLLIMASCHHYLHTVAASYPNHHGHDES